MTEPTAPQIPNDAPQDVKDFFDCKGSTLNWQSGDVTWLGLKVTPSVTFAPGANRGDVNITVGILGGMISFTLPASVNAAGELVVDTSSVPDLSEWGIGGRADIDAAIMRINEWFKHNGKKLKPARLAGGTVVLEKVPITPVAATVPAVAPVTPNPPAPPPPAAPPPASAPGTGGGCMLGILLFALLLGVVALGGGIGYVFLGGPGIGVTPTAAPTATVSPAPTARPTTSAQPSLSAPPSFTPQPTTTAQPTATATATPNVADMITALCARVVHRQFGDFFSYIEWLMYWDGYDVSHFVVTVSGANNGSPVNLVYQPNGDFWGARLGLFNPGTKSIVSLSAVLDDGSVIDITEAATEILGESMQVRYPQEDTFGDCQVFGTTTF